MRFAYGGFGENPGEISAVDLKLGSMYNVKKGAWHTHYFAPNTKVVIVENADTALENSPISSITEEQRKIIAELCLMWFDLPSVITKEQSTELRRLVKNIARI